MYEDNLFKQQAWEQSGADAVGLTLSMFRFMLAFFASIAVGAVFQLVPTVTGRHLYAIVTGLLLIYYPFGNGIFNAFVPAAVTYALMRLARPRCGSLAWLLNFSYLVYCHVASASGAAWKQGNMDFTGCQMVVTLKLISAAVSFQDGLRKEQALTQYQREHRLSRAPGVLEFLSYVFAAGNLLAGPFFEMSDYLTFVERRGPWAGDAGRPAPSPVRPGLLRVAKALACMALHLKLVATFNVDVLESGWYLRLPLLRKVAVIYAVGFTYRFKYYFAWTVAEAALILSGFCWNGRDAAGRPRWDRHSNARIASVELSTSLAELPTHWNICTGTFLRRYVYERLAPKNGRRPPFHVLLLTQLVSAVWHGIFPGYLMFFATTAFAFEASKVLFRYERGFGVPSTLLPLRLAKWALTAFVLNYAAATFLLIDFWPGLRVWRSVYFLGHVLVLAIMGLGTALPPPARKPAQAPADTPTAEPPAPLPQRGEGRAGDGSGARAQPAGPPPAQAHLSKKAA